MGRSTPRWQGRIRLWNGLAIYVGRVADTSIHSHHALQFAVGLEGPVAMDLDGRDLLRAPGIGVPPNLPHRLLGGEGPAALVFVEPESSMGRALCAGRAPGSPWPLDAKWVESLAMILSQITNEAADRAESLLAAQLRNLLPDSPPPSRAVDPRVTRTQRWLRDRGGVGSLKEAAVAQGLSVSRLGHLFTAQAGLPFRPYALWLRLQGALDELSRGSTLTQAAHSAGFADSAHLSRTFRRMFGIAPSELARLLGAK